MIKPLAARLEEAREKSMEIARLRGDEEEFVGRVSIQGDRAIQFAIVQRVMFTCSQSGFETISLAVIESSS
jgi:biopolymer transport protein ExbD